MIDLLSSQDKFIHTENRFPAIIGGLGSGKSRAGTFRLVSKILGDPGSNGAYYMPTYDLLSLRAIPGVQEDLDSLGIAYETNYTRKIIHIYGFGDIIFRSYDNPGKIIAYDVAHSICDELDTINKKKAKVVWRKITERNRQKRKSKNTIGLVTSPDQGIHCFSYDKWVKNRSHGYELIKASTRDNFYLPEDYVQNLLDNYDPILANLYIDGEYVSLNQDKIYHFFDRKTHHTDREINADDKYVYIGLDFNIGGCCATSAVIENNKPVFVDEFTSYDTHDFINNLTRYKDKIPVIYPDASGNSRSTNATESDISMIENAGFAVIYDNSNPAVRDRINSVNNLLSKGDILINTDKCPELAYAWETQGYDDKGRPEKFTDHPAIDDWTDGSGYLLHGRYPVNAGKYPRNAGFYK